MSELALSEGRGSTKAPVTRAAAKKSLRYFIGQNSSELDTSMINDQSEEQVQLYMLLRQDTKRLFAEDFIEALREKRKKVDIGGGRRAGFWIVPKENFKTLPANICAALLKDDVLERALKNTPDASTEDFWFVDQEIAREFLGRNVTEGFAIYHKYASLKEKKPTLQNTPAQRGAVASDQRGAGAGDQRQAVAGDQRGAVASDQRGADAGVVRGGDAGDERGALSGKSDAAVALGSCVKREREGDGGGDDPQCGPRQLKRQTSDADSADARLRATFQMLKGKMDAAKAANRWHSDDELDTDTVESWGSQVPPFLRFRE